MVFETYYKTGGLSRELTPQHRRILKGYLEHPGSKVGVAFSNAPLSEQGVTQDFKINNALNQLVNTGILVAHEPQFAVTLRRVQEAKRNSRLLHKVRPVEEVTGHLRTFRPTDQAVFHIEPSLVAAAHKFVSH
ncbi:MAG: hypothetical protein Q8R15_04355 [Candidatus Micrarchaeota archaeon]|nr:hypothetical protein [Candidatus Micrarchaeota archaeon]